MLALDVLGQTIAYWEELTKTGRITAHREYLSLTGNTSKITGMMVVEGDTEELFRVFSEDDSHDLLARAGMVCDNVTVEFMQTINDAAISRFVTSLSEMGIASPG
jgi:hypothetical protein